MNESLFIHYVTPPEIDCPPDIITNLVDVVSLQQPAPVTSDNSGLMVTWTSDWPANNGFLIGVTIVTYTATDAAGNMASCRMFVTVLAECPGYFLCDDPVHCEPLDVICDSVQNCIDGSDEDELLCPGPDIVCSVLEFECSNGMCIPAEQRCNGEINCSDGSDESFCDPDGDILCSALILYIEPGSTMSITSPSFPDVYPYPEEPTLCFFDFHTDNGYQLYIHFRYFDIGDGLLSIRSGPSAAYFTGPDANDVVGSNFIDLYVEFTSTSVGYWMEISSIERMVFPNCSNDIEVINESDFNNGIFDCSDNSDEPIELLCGPADITLDVAETYQLTSINYPNNYINQIQCVYVITAPEGRRLRITFLAFDLVTDRDEDFMIIGPLDNSPTDVFYDGINSVPMLDIVSLTETLQLRFFTGFRETATGFDLLLSETDDIDQYRCNNKLEVYDANQLCNLDDECLDNSDEWYCHYECDNQIINIPSGAIYELSVDLSITTSCRWVIHAAPGQRVHAQIIDYPEYPYILHVGSLDDPYITNIDFGDLELGGINEVVSPNEVLVLTWESLLAGPREKRQNGNSNIIIEFENVDPSDLMTCVDQVQVIEETDLCNNLEDCIDGSDETSECFCGPPKIELEIGACYNLSFPIEGLLQNPAGLPCRWEVCAPNGYKVYVQILFLGSAPFHLQFDAEGSSLGWFSLDDMHPDIVSPENILNIFVFLFEPNAEFLLKLSTTNDPDIVVCGNGLEVLPDESLLCDGTRDCRDGSDESQECYCGDSDINLSDDTESCYNLSYPVDGLFPGDFYCFWDIWVPDGFRVYGDIIYLRDVSVRLSFFILGPEDYLLDFVADGSHLRLQMSPSSPLAQPEFLLKLSSATNEMDFLLCDNGFQVLPDETYTCDGIRQCQDGSDEPSYCGCGDHEPLIFLDPLSGGEYLLTLKNYPANYFNSTQCEWTIVQAPYLADCYLYAEFLDFCLAREDYLYVSANGDFENALRYTKYRIPPGLLSSESMLITFTSDESESDVGFLIRFSVICGDVDTDTCDNGIEVLPAGATCNGTVECSDLSDELYCPPCETIPVEECLMLLPYNRTFYPDSPANSSEEAVLLYDYYQQEITDCSEDAIIMLCAIVFPPCPHDADEERLCQSFCLETTDNCPALFDLIGCEDLPVGEEYFCAVAEGDIFETGLCGTRPAFNPSIRVVGGEDAPPGSWPWICSLERYDDHFC
ncbi:uncharacterized protein [Amphiura filiformis]|uniref:uncharacterized protein n=1 Tax=Amphiura filiformis TaxID=82378 RepID=UPI003B222105